MILEIFFALSILLNISFIFYCRYLISQLKNISLDLVILKNVIFTYREELKKVYESELFYGEPTLEQLVEHTKAVSMDMEDIFNQYDFRELEEAIQEDFKE